MSSSQPWSDSAKFAALGMVPAVATLAIHGIVENEFRSRGSLYNVRYGTLSGRAMLMLISMVVFFFVALFLFRLGF